MDVAGLPESDSLVIEIIQGTTNKKLSGQIHFKSLKEFQDFDVYNWIMSGEDRPANKKFKETIYPNKTYKKYKIIPSDKLLVGVITYKNGKSRFGNVSFSICSE